MLQHQSLYCAFDLYPSAKGAATHIGHMAQSLFKYHSGGILLTLGNQRNLNREVENDIEIRRFTKLIPNYLTRANAFSAYVSQNVSVLPHLKTVHFRDIWSGLGLLRDNSSYSTLFEVNGLPSIELPYHYPSITADIIVKFRQLEDFCFHNSDHIIVPSKQIQRHLLQRGIKQAKIDVVPNAANPYPLFDNIETPEKYLLYFGAVQYWQGVDILLKSFALLRDIQGLKLVICCASKPRYAKELVKLAVQLGISEHIIWQYQLTKAELNTYIKGALLTVAPLKECSRNIDQGCSPLKIFESMACETPVIASDLPVVREIIEDNVTGKLVQPDRPQAMSRAIRLLIEYPEKRQSLAKSAKQLIISRYNWNAIDQKMGAIYKGKLS